MAAIRALSDRLGLGSRGAPIPPLFGALVGLVAAVLGLALLHLIYSASADRAAAVWQLPLVITALIIVGLFGFVVRRVVHLATTREGRAAPKLHFHLVRFMSIAALVPAILSGAFLTFIAVNVVESLFSSRVGAAVNTSAAVMREFLNDKLEDVTEAVRLMAEADLNQEDAINAFERSPVIYNSYLLQSAAIRGFEALHIVDSQGNPVMRAQLRATGPMLASLDQLNEADQGIVSWRLSRETGFLRLVYRLKPYSGHYAVVGMTLLDAETRSLVDRAEGVVVEYRAIEERRRAAQIFIAQLFVQVTALLMLGAIGVALVIANRIVSPVDRLVMGAKAVSEGNLHVRVPVGDEGNEITLLERAFNEMTHRLVEQQDALISAKHDAENRQAFTEAVLSGVSAGIISVAPDDCIALANADADDLLTEDLADPATLEGELLQHVAPELLQAVHDARAQVGTMVESEVEIERQGRSRRFSIRAASTRQDIEADHRVVVTFTDITRLVTAQRSAAWQDVARRIAHEIKNPLTPIQLSAERLRRRYRASISDDGDIFDKCVETIVRQVGDIRRMVDEFSAFARMPEPSYAPVDLVSLVQEQTFARRVANPLISVRLETGLERLMVVCDGRLVGQAITNVLKNAGEALTEQLNDGELPKDHRPTIEVRLSNEAGTALIEIIDNGPGWPVAARERLLEPYMTTREKGTGLGLAIVRRILEDHDGHLELDSRADGHRGAVVRMRLPLKSARVAHANDDVPADDNADNVVNLEEESLQHGP